VSETTSSNAIPRSVLVGAAVLIGSSILAAGAARWTGIGTTDNPTGDVVDRLALRFEDRADGAVAVFAAGDDRLVEVLAPGSHGFVRGVLRGLARERRARGVGSEPPFHLTRWADGRLSLDDPATGRTIELGAFGPTNAGAFAALFVAGKGTP
jgi:putative photosynthetic complex assembly protein